MTKAPDPTATAKARLRAIIEARRRSIDDAERVEAARRIATITVGWLAEHARPDAAVSAFLSIGQEIDTKPTLEQLAAAGRQLALPVMTGPRKPLEFRSWSPGEPLVTVKWGIREPSPAARPIRPDVLLVPLLAFDAGGGRLGYGGGYYDRTLSALRAGPGALAAGFAFDQQEVDAVPRSDYDEPLDWVLTPSGAIRCQP